MRKPLLSLTLAITALIIAACGADSGVTTLEATQTRPALAEATSTTVTPTPQDPPPPTTVPVPTTAPATTAPETTEPPVTTLPPILKPELYTTIAIADVVDVGDEKPQRDYDAFLAVALTDIEGWLESEYEPVFGEPFEPLAGGIYAGYPERTTPLPGCGEPETDYDELTLYVAFYCQFDDFIVYDDGSDGLLFQLADSFGPAVLGLVLAHEYGHALQQRTGTLQSNLPTIITEQQADCVAGAWMGRSYRGESPNLRVGDRDLRAALVGILEVRDPIGTDQFDPGGHGSGFDRVGAFQEGFFNGLGRCAGLIDDPLPLMPNEFVDTNDALAGGDAPYDCTEVPLSQRDDCTPGPTFLADDLNDFWQTVDPSFPTLSPAPVPNFEVFSCPDQIDIAAEVAYCPVTQTVAYDEPGVLELYREYGDFTLGYFYGIAWSEVEQILTGSTHTGEARALLNDCWTGAWVNDITVVDLQGSERPDNRVQSSPGDLDEAIQMAILLGDVGANLNVVGSPFEKIDSFRTGVLGGTAVCEALTSFE